MGNVTAPAATTCGSNQKTLSSFQGVPASLSEQQRLQILRASAASPDANKFIFSGIRPEGQSTPRDVVMRKRARAACEFAKELNPSLSTWFQTKSTRATSYAGRVLLTAKSAIVAPAGIASVLSEVPEAKTFSGLPEHLRALELEASRLVPVEPKYSPNQLHS